MTWFRPIRPPAGLRGVVECTWDASPEGRHDLVPDGSVELLWIEGRGTWVCGPDTTGWSFNLAPGTATTGVRFHPGASGLALGLPAAELVDRRVSLDAVLSDRIARALDDELHGANRPAARRHFLETFVGNRLRDAEGEPMIVATALLGRSRHPIGTLDRVADEFGVSLRQFRRRIHRPGPPHPGLQGHRGNDPRAAALDARSYVGGRPPVR